MSRRKSQKRVDLRIDDQHLLSVAGDLPELDQLTTRRIKTGVAEDGRIECTEETEQLCEAGVAHGGLLHPARQLLKENGHPVRVLGHVPRIPAPDLDRLVGCEQAIDQQVLGLVRHTGYGLIRYAPGVRPEWLIAQVALAWPDHSMAICTATYRQAKDLRAKLFALGVKTTLATRDRCPPRPGRIVIGTPAAMAHTQLESGKRDFVIFAHATHALSANAQPLLIQPDSRFRLIGLLPGDRHLSPYEQDRLVAIFGVHDVQLPAHGCQRLCPAIKWLPGNRKYTHTSDLTQDPIRNRRIARLAKDLHAGRYGEQPRCVVVLVDSVDQGIALAERLPGWPLVVEGAPTWPCEPTVYKDGLSTRQLRTFDRHRQLWVTGTHMIVTVAAAGQLDLRDGPCAVIWAGGGDHPAPLPDHWLDVPSDSDRLIALIDIDDRHPGLISATKRRQRGYRRQGWFKVGEDPLEEQIKDFLAARPKPKRRRHKRRPRK